MTQSPRSTSDKFAAIGTLSIFFFILITKTIQLYQINDTITTRRTSVESELKKRPVIHTFHGINKDFADNQIYQQAQMDLIETWKQMWYDAGWDPVVLTDEDAQRHADYEFYEEQISKLDIGYYDHLCFHRWMAMSMTEAGGWMTDIDTYPLWIEAKDGEPIPFDGAFMAYDGSLDDGAVPSLLSGSASEWERMLQALMSYVPNHEGEFFSDMRALQEYNLDKPGRFIIGHHVLTRVMKTVDGEIDCKALNGKLAFHLSHRAEKEALKDGHYEENENARSRAFYAREYRKDFLEHCKNKH